MKPFTCILEYNSKLPNSKHVCLVNFRVSEDWENVAFAWLLAANLSVTPGQRCTHKKPLALKKRGGEKRSFPYIGNPPPPFAIAQFESCEKAESIYGAGGDTIQGKISPKKCGPKIRRAIANFHFLVILLLGGWAAGEGAGRPLSQRYSGGLTMSTLRFFFINSEPVRVNW